MCFLWRQAKKKKKLQEVLDNRLQSRRCTYIHIYICMYGASVKVLLTSVRHVLFEANYMKSSRKDNKLPARMRGKKLHLSSGEVSLLQ